MDIRAYIALHLGGTPSQETGTSPPSCLLLKNCLYMSPDSHMKEQSMRLKLTLSYSWELLLLSLFLLRPTKNIEILLF